MTTPGWRTIWLALLVGLIAPGPTAVADELDPAVTHVVQRGETLSSIAAVYLGNPHLWPALYRANRDQIRDPARLYPGQALAIPATPTTVHPNRKNGDRTNRGGEGGARSGEGGAGRNAAATRFEHAAR